MKRPLIFDWSPLVGLVLIVGGIIDVCFFDPPPMAQAKLPPPVLGENFQRTNKLLDCQTLWVPKLEDAHREVKVTTCFYQIDVPGFKASATDPMPHLILAIQSDVGGNITTSYINQDPSWRKR